MAAADLVIRAFNTIGTVLLYSWPFILLGGIWWAKKNGSKWPIEVIIKERRGENLVKTNDRAGKFYDKNTLETKYKLKKAQDSIPVVDYDIMMHNADKPVGILGRIQRFFMPTIGTVELFRYGSKQYKPLKNTLGKENKLSLKEIKNRKGEAVYHYEYLPIDSKKELRGVEFEVVDWDNMNFMVTEQRATLQRRVLGGEWLKQMVIPLAIIGGSVIAALFILKFSADVGADLRAGAGQPKPEEPSGGVIAGAIGGAVTPGA